MKEKVRSLLDKLPPVMRNKYALASLAFLTYLMFFDSNDIPSQIRLHHHLHKLNSQIGYCEKMIEKDKQEYSATFSSPENMEAYAREEYLMKKPEEDLFIIEIK